MKPALLIKSSCCGIGAEIAYHAALKNYDICFNYASDHAQAEQVASRVRSQGAWVNATIPGIVDTEIKANSGRPSCFAERGSNPDEIANAVIWLLDEKNTYKNGACIPVSGGI